jgi:hypothetical protein
MNCLDLAKSLAPPIMAAVMVLAAPAGVAAETPFSSLAGSWAGTGQLRLDGGKTEQLSCRASYNPKDNGASLGMSLRCASPNYKVELRSSLRYDGGRISGDWEERTFNAGGGVSGRATPGSIQLSFTGNIAGSMSVTTAGGTQRVSMTTSGTGLAGLSLSLTKG